MSAQLWRCANCEATYWSPMSVAKVTCPGPHAPAGSRVMELILDGEAAEAVSPFKDELVTTVRRGKKGRV